MGTAELVVAFLSAVGAGAVLTKLIEGAARWFTGRQSRERQGWEAADEAERERRQWETWAHRVQLQGIRHGFDQLLPPTPADITPQSWETPGSIDPPGRD